MVVYIDGLINKDLLDRDIITPLKSDAFNGDISLTLKTHYTEVEDIPVFIDNIVQGNIAVFYEKSKKIFVVDFKHWDKRSGRNSRCRIHNSGGLKMVLPRALEPTRLS